MGLIAVVFFQWYAREQAEDQEPHWDDVEEELSQLGLTSAGWQTVGAPGPGRRLSGGGY